MICSVRVFFVAPLLSGVCTKHAGLISPHAAVDLDPPHITRNQSKVTTHTAVNHQGVNKVQLQTHTSGLTCQTLASFPVFGSFLVYF